jgi:hypothetical protein
MAADKINSILENLIGLMEVFKTENVQPVPKRIKQKPPRYQPRTALGERSILQQEGR